MILTSLDREARVPTLDVDVKDETVKLRWTFEQPWQNNFSILVKADGTCEMYDDKNVAYGQKESVQDIITRVKQLLGSNNKRTHGQLTFCDEEPCVETKTKAKDELQHVEIVNTDLLESDSTYIAHQCNCVSTSALGLAEKIFKKYPYSDVYARPVKVNKKQDKLGYIS